MRNLKIVLKQKEHLFSDWLATKAKKTVQSVHHTSPHPDIIQSMQVKFSPTKYAPPIKIKLEYHRKKYSPEIKQCLTLVD